MLGAFFGLPLVSAADVIRMGLDFMASCYDYGKDLFSTYGKDLSLTYEKVLFFTYGKYLSPIYGKEGVVAPRVELALLSLTGEDFATGLLVQR